MNLTDPSLDLNCLIILTLFINAILDSFSRKFLLRSVISSKEDTPL
jgi:hypothetical protein